MTCSSNSSTWKVEAEGSRPAWATRDYIFKKNERKKRRKRKPHCSDSSRYFELAVPSLPVLPTADLLSITAILYFLEKWKPTVRKLSLLSQHDAVCVSPDHFLPPLGNVRLPYGQTKLVFCTHQQHTRLWGPFADKPPRIFRDASLCVSTSQFLSDKYQDWITGPCGKCQLNSGQNR